MAASAGIILPGQTAASTTTPNASFLTLFAYLAASASPGPLPAWKDSNGNVHQFATLSGGGVYNVQDYGVLPANAAATNNTNMAALLAAATTGSTIYFPIGTYQFASAISVGAAYFIFQGAGQNSSILQTTSTTADIFTLTDANWYTEFRDLGFSTTVAKSAGNCITTGTSSGSGNVGINVRRCTFSGLTGTNTLYNGIVYAGMNSGYGTVLEDCTFSNFSNYGIWLEGNTSTPSSSANLFVTGCLLNGSLTSTNAVAGLYVQQGCSIHVVDSNINGCTSGIVLNTGSYGDILISNNDLASNTTPIVNNASGWVSLTITPGPGLATNGIPLTTASAGINTTATYVTPTSWTIPAGAVMVGTTYRVTLAGICTSTAANLSTFVLRIGTAGTTADTAIVSATCTAATSGTGVGFTVTFLVTIRSIGSSGSAWGSGQIQNSGTTGVSSNGVGGGVSASAVTVNTTVSNHIGVSYSSAATTTTCTFEQATLEVVNAA